MMTEASPYMPLSDSITVSRDDEQRPSSSEMAIGIRTAEIGDKYRHVYPKTAAELIALSQSARAAFKTSLTGHKS